MSFRYCFHYVLFKMDRVKPYPNIIYSKLR
nr:MAG TPA: hypothetical protein [Caudoviricetes sp.]